MENSFENIRYIALKIVTGEGLESMEEIEFYEDNKIEVDVLVEDYMDDEFSMDIIDFEDE